MTTTDHLSKLEQQAAAAEAKATRARQQAAEAAAEAEVRREARHVDYDRARLDAFDEAKLEADWRQAEADFRRAVLDDPLCRAWINYQVATMRRSYRHAEAASDAARLGEAPRIFPTSSPGYPEWQAVSVIISDEASQLARDEQMHRDEDREAAGDEAAGTGG